MACEPTTRLDDERAASDRRDAATPHTPADRRLVDSLVSNANQPAALSADEIERIVQSRHDMP
jgi:hypothetical protein